jgi:adenylosuccinate synthase
MTNRSGLLAFAVVDLGFGDSGKGLLTDYLTRRVRADVVVRFGGGAQAGHNVVTADGRHHTFAQFGAGSFSPGVRTFLSRHVAVHPTALLVEAAALARAGVHDSLDRIAVSENAVLITPFHQALNRLRELARGDARHGSCGIGMGEAVRDAATHPHDAVRAGDLREPAVLARRLARIRERLAPEALALGVPTSSAGAAEREMFEDPDVAHRWSALASPVAARVVADDTLARWLEHARAVVFEGAHGVLLDAAFGFHPHTTRSSCTADQARTLLAESAPGVPLRTWGVLRAHAVRHGAGPLPSEDPVLRGLVHEHNTTNAWQGPVRYGWFDAVLARYALSVAPGIDALALTHVDALPRRTTWSVCDSYDVARGDDDELLVRRGGAVVDLIPRIDSSIQRQARLGSLLAHCRPILDSVLADEASYIACIERRLGRSIDVVSRGPTAGDVDLRAARLLDPGK